MPGIEGEDEQPDLDFNAGFETEAPLADKKPPASQPEPQKPAKVQSAPEKTQPKPQDHPAPKYRRITEDEFNRIDAAIKTIVTSEKVKDVVHGTLGNLEERIVARLQSQTPQGMTVELPPDVVSEMEKDYPELAGHFKTSLERALKGLKGTAPVTQSAPEKIDVEPLISAAVIRIETEALEDAYPNWRDIVGVGLDGSHDPKHPFRTWLKKQPEAYQAKINATNSALIIQRAIERFKASQAPKTPAKDTHNRRERFASAVQPKGDGRPPPPKPNAEDDFEEGFRTG